MAITNVKNSFSDYTFDDFDETKNYQRILFKPGFAVQARELTQLQTALQAQIDKLGQFAFSDGQRVINGHPTLNVDFDYIKIEPQHSGSAVTNPELFLGSTITGSANATNQVTATVIHVEAATDTDPITLYLQYTSSGGTSRNISKFVAGESISGPVIVGGSTITKSATIGGGAGSTIANADNAVGVGSQVSISEGVYFISGNFVHIPAASLILEKYTSLANYIVGLQISETVVNSSTTGHTGLLDNASGSTNASAPGADRYVIDTTLIKQAVTDDDPAGLIARADALIGVDNYIHLLTVKNGISFSNVEDNVDTELNKLLAERTEEESGNYTVDPFVLDIKEDKNENGNFGHSATGDTDKIYVGIEQGVAYVEGHRIQTAKNGEVRLDKPRANDTEVVAETIQSVGYGNFIELVKAETEGIPDITDLSTIELWNNAAAGESSAGAGTQIGTARVRDMRYDSVKDVYRLFIFDIKMTSESFGAVKSVKQEDANNNDTFNAKLSTFGKVFQAANNSLVYKLPANAISTLKDGSSHTVDADFRVEVVSSDSVSGGAVTVALGTPLANKNDVLVYSGDADTAGYPRRVHALGAGNFANTVSVGDSSMDLENLDAELNGQPLVVMFTTRKTNTAAKTKTYKTNATKTFAIAGGSISSSYTLSAHDAVNLHSVKRTANSTGTAISPAEDFTDSFILDGGQRDNFYDTGKVVVKQGAILPNGTYTITFDHFQHGGSGDYFSVDSYIPGTTGLATVYDLIPNYKGTSLRDAIDFRPTKKIDTDSFDTTGTGGAVTFTSGICPSEGSIELRLEYYKGRIDKLFLNKRGEFVVIKGIADRKPVAPEGIEGAIHLYTFILNPYVFGVQDVIVIPIDNRRYTMRDIAKIDKRVKNLEYYTSLSLLEKSAAQADISDSAGDVRFKNGFIVDGFFGHNVGNPSNPEYSVSIDSKNGILRPKHDTKSVNIIRKTSDSSSASSNAARAAADKNSNKCTTSVSGGVVTLPYTIKTEINQPYASYAEFVNPYNVIAWDGTMKLSPESDEWKEVDQRPDVIVNDNSQYDQFVAMADAEGILNTVWNEWETNWTGEEILSEASYTDKIDLRVGDNEARVERQTGTTNSQDKWFADVTTNITAIKTTSTQTRSGTQASIESSTQSKVIGNFTVETSYIPFMRSRKVYFDAQLLKPNTKMYAFFDGADVTSYCKQEMAGSVHADSDFVEFSSIVNGDAAITYKGATSHNNATSGTGGGTLTTDASGRLIGSLIIPNNSTFRFKTGTKTLKLTDSPTNNTGTLEDETTSVIENYYAQGLLETRQRTIINTKVPRIVHKELRKSRTITSNRTDISHELVEYYDPIAESFVVDADGGIFTTGVELFFNKIDPAIPVTVSIREVQNGVPTQIVIPGAEKIVYPSDIVSGTAFTTSNYDVTDASNATEINWDFPIHLKQGKEYAIVCISNSDKYKVFVAETSKFDLTDTSFRITKQPFNGVFFTSANASTWSPEQNKDLKFKLKRASFSTSACTMNLVNDKLPLDALPNNPLTFLGNVDGNSTRIRVSHPNHGMYGVEASIGQAIHSVSISGVVGTVNGVAAARINGDHNVVGGSQTLDSYEIIVGAAGSVAQITTGTEGLAGGGANIKASSNRPYNILKLSSSTIEFKDSTISYKMKGATARSQDSNNVTLDGAYTILPTGTDYKPILANKNMVMEQPMLVASDRNQTFANIGSESFQLVCTFKTENENISPVLDLNRTSLITVSNRINDATTLSSNYGTYHVPDTKSTNTTNDAKYITKTVELDSSAEEIDIYLNANRPNHSNIDVFYKVGQDDAVINDTDWTLIEPESAIPINDNGVYSEVHYVKDFGQLATPITFSKFIIKIVLRSQNSSNVPTVKDFRAIATL
jgi:hypothetical protein